jgi:putative membrane protein
MKALIRAGLAAGLGGALAFAGVARAQQDKSASGGAGPSPGSGSTLAGAPSAGPKIDETLTSELERLHAGNQGEIQLAQVALEKAQSPEVKSFAERMRSEHEQMDGELIQVAQAAGVNLEGKAFQKEQQAAAKQAKKLKSKTGAAFDKAYMTAMVKGHEETAKTAKDAAQRAQKVNEPELLSALQKAETQVQSHLAQAKQVEHSLGKHPSSATSKNP